MRPRLLSTRAPGARRSVLGALIPLIPLVAVAAGLGGCAQPTLLSCPAGTEPCAEGCVDLRSSVTSCGACGQACPTGETCAAGGCVPGFAAGVCEVNNGGCSPDAACVDVGGVADCTCLPGLTGDGVTCAPCTACGADSFAAIGCTPTTDTTCALCAAPCEGGTFEVQPCGPFTDRACQLCSVCVPGTYPAAGCAGGQDTQCAPCEPGCLACQGPGASCLACDTGFTLVGGTCVVFMATCANAIIEPGEQCDDGNTAPGDGCDALCAVEPGSYCFGEGPSRCRAGDCVVEPATALPLGPAFAIDGTATASAAGLTLTERSTVFTTADLAYPVMIEATVVYASGALTFIGARGSGERDLAAGGEPTDGLRGRLGSDVELLAGTTLLTAATPAFTPSPGTPYRVRYIDDGAVAAVEWFDPASPGEGIGIAFPSTFHGTADRAFVGADADATIRDVRVCSAPVLPVTEGLVARYSAIPSWTVLQDAAGKVSQWQDAVGGHHLGASGEPPVFARGLFGGLAALDLDGGRRLATAPFGLSSDVTVFAVIEHRVPATWGAIAHHGSRDLDWSLEQSGFSGSPDVLHWQSNNDNTALDVGVAAGLRYVLAGRIAGTARAFSVATFDGQPPTLVETIDAAASITPGDKVLYVGTSDAAEASNAAIGELVYFARALTDAEREAVIAYLQAVWRP